MREIECDILVVGAGPSGSSAAWSSAKEDLDVMILEEKKIPTKDACAETLSKGFLKYVPFKIPNRFLKRELNGLKFYYENFQITRDEGIWWKSYPLDRKKFDPFVLDLAINEGANYLPLTKFIDLQYDNNYMVKKVTVKNLKNNELIKIKPKILIAADGIQSEVLKSIGKITKQNTAIGFIKSYEFENLNLDDSYYGHVFFGEFADGAYGYIFPKSETSANIGIATLSDRDIDLKFKEFLNIIKEQVKDSEMVVDRSGKAPIKNPSEKISYGNILFTGDAANQNIKPFVEGIIPGITCGSLAGESAANCLTRIKELESTYLKMIEEKMGDIFTESDKLESALVATYENKSPFRFLLALGIFSDKLNYKDLVKLEELKDKEADIFIKEKLNLNP